MTERRVMEDEAGTAGASGPRGPLAPMVRSLRHTSFAALVVLQCTMPSSDAPASGTRSGVNAAAICAPEPASVSPVLFTEGFEDNCFKQRGWYDNTKAPVTHAEHAPGGTAAAEFAFRKGDTKPIGGEAMRRSFRPSTSVFVSYRVKYSPGWIGSGKSYHPHEFMILSSLDGDFDGPSYNWLTLYIEQNYEDGGRPRLAMQDSKSINTRLGALPQRLVGVTDDRSTGGCNGVLEPDVVTECYNAPPWTNNKQLRGPNVFKASPGPGYISSWNLVEAYFQLNTVDDGIARRDGVMQYWFNGALIIDRHDIAFRTAMRRNLTLDQFLIAPYIGDGSPVDQTMYVDDLVVATRRPNTP